MTLLEHQGSLHTGCHDGVETRCSNRPARRLFGAQSPEPHERARSEDPLYGRGRHHSQLCAAEAKVSGAHLCLSLRLGAGTVALAQGDPRQDCRSASRYIVVAHRARRHRRHCGIIIEHALGQGCSGWREFGIQYVRIHPAGGLGRRAHGLVYHKCGRIRSGWKAIYVARNALEDP